MISSSIYVLNTGYATILSILNALPTLFLIFICAIDESFHIGIVLTIGRVTPKNRSK
jgi:hypothetical protein